MTTHPLVSICVTNCNYGRFVASALEGLLAQTYAPIEIVVVDDGSADDSREVLAKYEDRVRLELQPNGGQRAASNRAYELASGDIVLFHDADDLLEPDAVERIVATFAHPAVTLVLGRLRDIDETGDLLPGLRPPAGCRLWGGDLRRLVADHGTFIWPETTGLSFRRSALDPYMPIPEPLVPDHYLSNVAALAGTVVVLDEPVGRYRVHGANKSLAPRWRGVAWLDYKLNERRVIDHSVALIAYELGVVATEPGPVDRPEQSPHDHIRAELELAQRRLTGQRGAVKWAIEGVRSIATHPQFSWGARSRHIAWFVGAAIAPRPMAVRLVESRYPFVKAPA